jgi:hypothetical protein
MKDWGRELSNAPPLSVRQGAAGGELSVDEGLSTRMACSEVHWQYIEFCLVYFSGLNALSKQPVQS